MSIKAWPFLVSRNKDLGYRAIVAPDFFVEEKITRLLAEAAGGELTQDEANYVEIHNSRLGKISLVFRILRAKRKYIGEPEEGVLHDSYGRPITWIEGLVTRENFTSNTAICTYSELSELITEEVFSEVYSIVQEHYKTFWGDKIGRFKVKPSQEFLLTKTDADSSKKIGLKHRSPYILPKYKRNLSWREHQDTDLPYKKSRVKNAVLSPKEKRIAVVYQNSHAYIFDVEFDADNKSLKRLTNIVKKSYRTEHLSGASSLAIPSDEKFVFGMEENRDNIRLIVHELRDQRLHETIYPQHTDDNYGDVKAVAYDSVNRRVVIVAEKKNSSIFILNHESDFLEVSVSYSISKIRSIVFHPSENKIAIGDKGAISLLTDCLPCREDNQSVAELSSSRDSPLQVLKHESSTTKICVLIFAKNGKFLASADIDGNVYVWETNTGRQVAHFKEHTKAVNALAFSYDNKFLASCSEDGSIKIQNLEQKEMVSSFGSYSEGVCFVSFLHSGLDLVSMSRSGNIKTWKLEA